VRATFPGTPATRWSSAALASVLVVAGAFLRGGRRGFWVNAFFLVVVFLVPAQGLTRPGDVGRLWRPLLLTAAAGTLGWDAATAFVAGSRPFLSEWYLVYTSGPLVFMLLYLAHAALAKKLARVLHEPPSEPS